MQTAKIDVLKSFINKITNLKPLMREISEDMLDAVKENFEREGRPKWKPLARSTIKERKRLGYWPGKILQRTGMLLRSISKKYDSTSVVIGTNKIYAAIHQFGGSFTSKTNAGKNKKVNKIRFMKSKTIKIPARPFLTLPPNELEKIKRKIEHRIVKN